MHQPAPRRPALGQDHLLSQPGSAAHAAGAFPVDLIGEIIRGTAARYPTEGGFDLRFTDPRGSDVISFTQEMRANQLATQPLARPDDGRGRRLLRAYLPTHGPNLWDHNSVKNDFKAVVPMAGVLYPQWAVSFAKPFEEKIAVHFEGDTISSVEGISEEAVILREMLVGGRMIEGGGCGFNPKAPRHAFTRRAPTRPARCTSA